MKIEIEIIPESENGEYTLLWHDTLNRSQFSDDEFFLRQRPQELYCYIFNNNNDTLGYYKGLSSPQQFTYFQTTDNSDSILNLKFSVGINHFSEFLAVQSEEYIAEFNENNKEQIEFREIKIDLKNNLRRKIEVELIKIN